MASETSTVALDNAPLTIAHGRKLFDQGKTIAATLDRIAPLLEAMDKVSSEETQDPALKIVELLTTIVDAQQLFAQRQEFIDQKLDFLISQLVGAEPFGNSEG